MNKNVLFNREVYCNSDFRILKIRYFNSRLYFYYYYFFLTKQIVYTFCSLTHSLTPSHSLSLSHTYTDTHPHIYSCFHFIRIWKWHVCLFDCFSFRHFRPDLSNLFMSVCPFFYSKNILHIHDMPARKQI